MEEDFQIIPLTVASWDAFEELFGGRGACGGCWCMHWRLGANEFELGKGDGNRKRMRKRVEEGPLVPGLLGRVNGQVVGWISVGPRSGYARLKRSRVLGPLGKEDTWVIVCFFIKKEFRRKGYLEKLIEGAVGLARDHGAHLLEAFPVDVGGRKDYPDTFAFTGLPGPFQRLGFLEVARRSPTRPVFHLTL